MDKKRVIAIMIGLLGVLSLTLILVSIENENITGKVILTGNAVAGQSCLSTEQTQCDSQGNLLVCVPYSESENRWEKAPSQLVGVCTPVPFGDYESSPINLGQSSGAMIVFIIILVLIVLATIGFVAYYLITKDNETRNPKRPGMPGRPGMPPRPGMPRPPGSATIRTGSQPIKLPPPKTPLKK